MAPDDVQDGYVVAIDQGTSSTKAIAIDAGGNVIATTKVAVDCHHPQPGWVEQDGAQIWESVRLALDQIADLLDEFTPDGAAKVVGLGLSTQRESALAWDRETGALLSPMIGWQDRRTAGRARELSSENDQIVAHIRQISGLPLDPMFSALKFEWMWQNLLQHTPPATHGTLALGTVDSWLMWNLTGEHRIELGNASRTQLLDIHTGKWSPELIELFGVPSESLPRLSASNEPSDVLKISHRFHPRARVYAVLADSHAALAGHGIDAPGQVKVTYGTGSSLMGLRAADAPAPAGLVDTIAWATPDPVYACEGNILATGATIVWLSQFLQVEPSQIFDAATTASLDSGLNVVPAFAGLGAPWWDETAQAMIVGLTLGTTQADVSRAAVESIPLQIEDLLAAFELGGTNVSVVHVDGGPTQNPWLMQLQADLSQREIIRTAISDLSAFGVAELAALTAGLIAEPVARKVEEYAPQLPAEHAQQRKDSWRVAIAKSRATD